jgi:hypothetical protein
MLSRPIRPRTSAALMAAGFVIALLVAVLALFRVSSAEGAIATLQVKASRNADASNANADALREANTRLTDAGEDPVEIPVPGPIGPAGQAGAAGEPGVNGVDGAEGVQGPQGEQGGPGASGSDGLQGPPGAAGSDGSNGADGKNGSDGSTVQGPAGPQGDRGEQGPKGDAGADGQPPVSWTYEQFGVTYRCARTDPFDPSAPAYDCAPDEP